MYNYINIVSHITIISQWHITPGYRHPNSLFLRLNKLGIRRGQARSGDDSRKMVECSEACKCKPIATYSNCLLICHE